MTPAKLNRRSPPVTMLRQLGILLLICSASAPLLAAANDLPDFETLVKERASSVVNIQTKRQASVAAQTRGPGPQGQIPEFLQRFRNFQQPGPQQPQPPGHGQRQAIGSGVIASANGYVLTNAHVVEGASEIVVQLNDQREFAATLVGADSHSDIAVLKIEASELPAAKFGDSDKLNVGQWVLAIGAPFGLNQTATQGIVSAVSRSLPNDTYVPFIQTDVAVNPGNSGGPLFNLNGEVIGINSQIFSRTGGYMGLSFAIPINLASNIAEQLKTTGTIARGWLGVSIQDLDQSLAQSFALDSPRGALISSVTPNSPAANAALKAGDVIIEYNGTAISRSAALPPLVAATAANSQTSMRIWRNGKAQDIVIRVGLLPGQPLAASTPKPGPLGVVVSDLTAAEVAALGVQNGVRVDRVEAGKPAALAGLQANDVIVAFNHESVDNAAELVRLSRESAPGATVPLLVQRKDQTRFLALQLPAANLG